MARHAAGETDLLQQKPSLTARVVREISTRAPVRTLTAALRSSYGPQGHTGGTAGGQRITSLLHPSLARSERHLLQKNMVALGEGEEDSGRQAAGPDFDFTRRSRAGLELPRPAS